LIERIDTLRTVEAPEGVELSLRVAGPYPRALAYMLDFLIRMFVYSLVGLAAALLGGTGQGLYYVVMFVCESFYPVVFEVYFGGATPGKRALGLQVLRDDGTPIGLTQSLLRNLMLSADLFPFGAPGLVSCLFSRDFKRLGDRVAGTVVVHVEERWRPHSLSKATPLAPPFALQLEEQAALVEFSVRAPAWRLERAIEVGDHLTPLSSASGSDGVRRLLGMAQWIEGAR
jgi:uncharacterized RDD family membrane protein YckC